jgi:hypothetical protein
MRHRQTLEEPLCIPSADRIEGTTHRFHESFSTACLSLSQDALYLAERLFDGVANKKRTGR